MKQLLLLIFTLLGLSAWGQKQSVATFDFTKTTGVYPNINLPSNLASMDISSARFTFGNVTLSFKKGEGQTLGAQFRPNDKSDSNEYFVELNRGAFINFSAVNGASIDSIKFEVVEGMYDITLVKNSPGTLSVDRYKRFWSKNGNETVTAVSFRNVGKASEITKAIVYYTTPRATLTPVSSDLTASSIISFSNGRLNFGTSVTVKSSTDSYISDSNGNRQALALSATGNVVTLSVSKEITTDGRYTIYIPEGSIWNADGYCNQALTYTINIVTPKNTLKFASVSPSEGEIDILKSPVVLDFNQYLKSFTNKDLFIYKDGAKVTKAQMARSSENSKQVVISFDIPEGLKDKGIYTITVDEKTIYDQLEETYNPAFTLTYKVGYEKEPETPEASETHKMAESLLNKTGVGYPAEESASRKRLKELVDKVPFASDKEIAAAIQDFYGESNVLMPENGKYYYISSVNSANNMLYVCVDNNEYVSFTTDKNQATAFLCSVENETYSFKSQQNKYFYVNGLTEGKGKDLTLEKFKLSGVEDKSVLGTFCLYGYCSTNSEDKDFNAYAMVNHTTGKIATDVTASSKHFTEKLSNAFIYTETVKPADVTEAVDFQMTLVQREFTDNQGILQLTTSTLTALTVNSKASTAALLNKEGNPIMTLNMALESGSVIKIPFNQLSNDTYYIRVPQGSIFGMKSGKKYTNNEFTLEFVVNKKGTVIPPVDADFNEGYRAVSYHPSGAEYYQDVDLNYFSITDPKYYDGFVVDVTKTIELVQPDTYKTVRKGHFKKVDHINGHPEITNAYQVEFDTPINKGDLPSDTYVIVIPKATIGDNNYAKYLNDPTSMDPKLCKVNPVMRFSFRIDNDKVTGIESIATGDNVEKKIYTLQGVRVSKMTTPGIYIVNGKKVVKRRE